ncbi:hypothetical protein NW062_00315 [Mycoplasmopsis cynos]|nr:hypothetical protein NW062_00315 [Mycoplasmopsis cynos]
MKSKKMSLILGFAIPLGIIASSSSIIGCNILDKPKSKNSEELKDEIKSLNEKAQHLLESKTQKEKDNALLQNKLQKVTSDFRTKEDNVKLLEKEIQKLEQRFNLLNNKQAPLQRELTEIIKKLNDFQAKLETNKKEQTKIENDLAKEKENEKITKLEIEQKTNELAKKDAIKKKAEAEKEYSGGFFDDKNDEVNELAKKLEESKKYEAEIKSKYIEEEKKLTKIEIKLKELKEVKEKSITSDADEKYASEEFLKSKENVEKQFYNIKQWVVESRKINSELKEVSEWLKNHSESSKLENINYFEYKENINKQKELSSEIEKLQKNIVHAAKLIHEYKEDVEFWKDPLSVLNPTLLKNIEDFVREKYLFNYEKDNLVLVLGEFWKTWCYWK